MGLDSVELVMSVEEKFGIRIPDTECQKIYTVQDFSDIVYDMISVNPTDKCLTQVFFYRLRRALKKLNLINVKIKPNSKITDLLTESELKANWNKLEAELGLKLPELVSLDFNPNLESYVTFLGIRTIKRNTPVTKGLIKHLIDWIISLNIKKVIDIQKISNKYEVERVISGIISKNMGIPISEIKLEHSITKDLGID